jgi:hypothetical protein
MLFLKKFNKRQRYCVKELVWTCLKSPERNRHLEKTQTTHEGYNKVLPLFYLIFCFKYKFKFKRFWILKNFINLPSLFNHFNEEIFVNYFH